MDSRETSLPKANILIVDDKPENLRILTHMLSQKGYQVRPVLDGQMALKTASKKPPDLILLDIMLPNIDGYEVCRQLKSDEKTRDIPVIFISAFDETIDRIKAFDVGAIDYIPKPFQAKEVLARVEVHLRVQNMQRQLREQNIRLQQEIAERKRAEEFLRELQKAVETTEIGITITDRDGRIVYTNPADAKIHGYTREELIGQHSNIFTTPEFREQGTRTRKDFQGIPNWKRERINMRKDGSVFPVELISNPIYDEKRALVGIVTICKDITEQKQAEEELHRAKETALAAKNAAEEAQRVAEAANQAKSQFLANMSHELRTPLNAIIGFSQLLTHSDNLTSEQRKNLDIISRSGEHLLTLLNQVLDLSKIEAGHLILNEHNFDLYGLLDDVADMFRIRAERKGLRLCVDRPSEVPQYVRMDEVKLRQIIINLLSNAIKFTKEGEIKL